MPNGFPAMGGTRRIRLYSIYSSPTGACETVQTRRGAPAGLRRDVHDRHMRVPRDLGCTPFVIKFLLLLLNFVLYVLPLVLCVYSTYFTLYSAHDVYSVCTLRTPRCAPKVHSEYRQSTLYSTRPMRVHSEYMAHFEVQSTQ